MEGTGEKQNWGAVREGRGRPNQELLNRKFGAQTPVSLDHSPALMLA